MKFKTVAIFIPGGHSSQGKSMIFRHFESRAGYVRSFILARKCRTTISQFLSSSSPNSVNFVRFLKVTCQNLRILSIQYNRNFENGAKDFVLLLTKRRTFFGHPVLRCDKFPPERSLKLCWVYLFIRF